MPKKKYIVDLTSEEREELKALISSGVAPARKLSRGRILLKADEEWIDKDISGGLGVGTPTVERVRKRFVEWGGIKAIERRKPRRQHERKLDADAEARRIALACSAPSEGRTRWTLHIITSNRAPEEWPDLFGEPLLAVAGLDRLTHQA